MSEIETHPFAPFVPKGSKKLIIGSFPGIEQVKSLDIANQWFYSATDNLFWKILTEAFNIDLKTVSQRKEFFENRGIAITDIFSKIQRKENSNLDKFIIPIEYNKNIREIIIANKIEVILFTSKFVENHFLKVFPELRNGKCLPSPSPAANIPISISDEYKNYIEKNPEGNTYSYRVYKYKELMS